MSHHVPRASVVVRLEASHRWVGCESEAVDSAGLGLDIDAGTAAAAISLMDLCCRHFFRPTTATTHT